MHYYGEKGSSPNLRKLVSLVFGQNITQMSALTVALSTSQMSHVFKACYLQAVISHCLSKSCLLTLTMTACKTFLLDFQLNQLSSNACHVFHAAPIHFWDLLCTELLSYVKEHRGKKKVTNFFYFQVGLYKMKPGNSQIKQLQAKDWFLPWAKSEFWAEPWGDRC